MLVIVFVTIDSEKALFEDDQLNIAVPVPSLAPHYILPVSL